MLPTLFDLAVLLCLGLVLVCFASGLLSLMAQLLVSVTWSSILVVSVIFIAYFAGGMVLSQQPSAQESPFMSEIKHAIRQSWFMRWMDYYLEIVPDGVVQRSANPINRQEVMMKFGQHSGYTQWFSRVFSSSNTKKQQ